MFIDAGNRENYLWSGQVNTRYEQYRRDANPARQTQLLSLILTALLRKLSFIIVGIPEHFTVCSRPSSVMRTE